jgi:hypothetical protein
MFSQDCCGHSLAPVNIVGSPGLASTPGANGANGALVLLGQAVSANFHVTGDIPITGFPANYIITAIIIQTASATLAGAIGGVYTAPLAAGTALVLGTQSFGAVTTPSSYLTLTLVAPAPVSGNVRTESTLYLNLGTPSAGLATANVNVYGYAL